MSKGPSGSLPEGGTTTLGEETVCIARHPLYYAVDDSVTFLIESKLYRIPRCVLLQSEFFLSMFQSPPLGDLANREGQTDESPIIPEGVTTLEIENLLRLLYARVLDPPPIFGLRQLSAILHLSTRWGFDKAREYAINGIDKKFQPTIDRIELAFKCSVPKWLGPAYEELCNRTTKLTADEARRLGISKYYALTQVREARLQASSVKSPPTSPTWSTLATPGIPPTPRPTATFDPQKKPLPTTRPVSFDVKQELKHFRQELGLPDSW